MSHRVSYEVGNPYKPACRKPHPCGFAHRGTKVCVSPWRAATMEWLVKFWIQIAWSVLKPLFCLRYPSMAYVVARCTQRPFANHVANWGCEGLCELQNTHGIVSTSQVEHFSRKNMNGRLVPVLVFSMLFSVLGPLLKRIMSRSEEVGNLRETSNALMSKRCLSLLSS